MKPVYRNLIILCLFFCAVAYLWHVGNLKAYVNLATIKDNQQFLTTHVQNKPLFCGVLYIVTFFILALTGLPVTLIMIITGGFLFGPFMGSFYSLIAVITSAVTLFIVSKKMFGHYIQKKYSQELKTFNKNFTTYGFYYLIIVRMLPIVPFFIVNSAAGFTNIDTKTFVLSTLLGALPMILFCSYLGSQFASFVVNC